MLDKAILCVHDEALVLQSLQGQLQRDLGSDYLIKVAQSDEEALQILDELARQHIEVPIIISNHTMPGMNQAELLSQEHERFPETLKIFLTRRAGADPVRSAHLYRSIFKPWNAEDLHLTVVEGLHSPRQQGILKRYRATLPKLYRHAQKELVERGQIKIVPGESLNYQKMAAALFAPLVSLPIGEVDAYLERALQCLVESLSIDAITLGEFSQDLQELHTTHSYVAPGIELFPKVMVAKVLPWLAGELLAGEIIKFEHALELPAEATAEKAYCQKAGIKSLLGIPVSIGNKMICVVTFSSVRASRCWPDDLVDELRRVAENFAQALYRKRAEQRLENQSQFDRLISNTASRFLRIQPDQVDHEVEQTLRQIVSSCQADRCGLLKVSQSKKEGQLIYACYVDGGVPRIPGTFDFKDTFPWDVGKVLSGETVSFYANDPPLVAALNAQGDAEQIALRSCLVLPLIIQESVDWIVVVDALQSDRTWSHEVIARLRLIGAVLVNALERKRAEEELQKCHREIKQLRDRLHAEAEYLHAEIKVNQRYGNIVGESAAIRKVLSQVEKVAATDSLVLIHGETGTGKELIARAIHDLSPRKNRAMVKVNCATLPSTLIESELFGREKGAYTGAMTKQTGRFEFADGSTIFLDEIGELSPELQSKLLRVLQEGEFERLGSPKTIKVNVRVIAATNRDLAEEARQGRFRQDLYYRLNVFPVQMPALRERADDIPSLVWAFIDEFSQKMGKMIRAVPKKNMEMLQNYHWPGNIRQLRNVIEHAMIVSTGKTLHVELPETSTSPNSEVITLEEVETRHITEMLVKTNWRIKGQAGAAKALGLNPGTLYSRMRKLGILIPSRKG